MLICKHFKISNAYFYVLSCSVTIEVLFYQYIRKKSFLCKDAKVVINFKFYSVLEIIVKKKNTYKFHQIIIVNYLRKFNLSTTKIQNAGIIHITVCFLQGKMFIVYALFC